MATASRLLEGVIAATSSGLAAQDLRKSRKSDVVFCLVKMSLRFATAAGIAPCRMLRINPG